MTGTNMKRIGLSLAVLLIIIATSNVQAADVPPAPDEEGVWVVFPWESERDYGNF